MINQSKENETYITGVEEKNEEEKSIQYSTKNSPNKYIKRNYKPIEHSDSKKNENIISIVFPSIKPHNTNKISNLLISSEKYIKIKQDVDEEKNSKSQKNISVAISNMRNKAKNLYYDNSTYKNSNSIQNDSKNNISMNNDYYMTSVKETKKPYISQIECSLNIENNNNKKLYNRYNILFNSPSSKTQILKQKLFNKEQGANLLNKFLKKELKMEEKNGLFPIFLERYSPRLLRKRNTKKNFLKYNNYNGNINNTNDEYKIKNGIFKNQTIPYLDKIDVRKNSSNLPPIILGSLYNLPNKSEESIKKEKFYIEVEKLERENRKGKSKPNKKITKKEMLKIIKNKKLIKCKNLIYKTKNNITETKDKIEKYYNKLKISLNQFDNWNNPENVDNLYDS